MRKALCIFLLLACALFGAEPDFTLMLLPDTQYLVFTCSPQVLDVQMNWINTNKNANLGNNDQGTNLTLNTKAVIGLGDAAQQAGSGEYSRIKGSTTSGYGILDQNNICFVQPPGNHDYVDPTTDHTVYSVGYTNNATPLNGGALSAAYRQAKMCSTGTFGGSYDDANYYIKIVVGSLRLLIFSIEFQPRAAVLTWAKGIHDANYGWSAIIATHAFQATNATLSRFSGESGNSATNNDNNGYGLTTAQATSDANFNSGFAMWGSYLNAWSQLMLVVNGHFLSYENSWGASPYNYLYRNLALTSTSSRGQTVQSIFSNWQDIDAGSGGTGSPPTVTGGTYTTWVNAGNAPQLVADYCTGNNWAPYRLAHVTILQVRPSLGVIEGYTVTTTMNKWEPSQTNRITTAPSSTPQLQFSVAYTAAKRPVFPMGAAVGPQ